MLHWWVRHDRNWRHELAGGYIWAPKRNSAGRRTRYADTIRSIVAGDAILSWIAGEIGHVGQVLDQAIGEPGRDGDGWWLPVDWTALPHPVRRTPGPPAPLAALPEPAFRAILDEAGLPAWPPPLADDEAPGAAARLAASRLDYDPALAASVRDRQVKARRGQGLFRFRVFQLERCCRLTGIARPDLLIASHIKPWRLCATTLERLDGANGLLLTPHVDRLFDRGLIAFEDMGAVLRSRWLAKDDLARLGLDDACARNVGAFSARQCRYLAWHREIVFERGR